MIGTVAKQIISFAKNHRITTTLLIAGFLILSFLSFGGRIVHYSEILLTKIGMPTNTVGKLLDQFNIKKTRFGRSRLNLDTYDIHFSIDDKTYFDQAVAKAKIQGHLDDEINKWRDAELLINGEIFKIKIKLIGDLAMHWTGTDKSWTIQFKDRFYKNMRRLDLKLASDKNPNQGVFEIERLLVSKLGIRFSKNTWIGMVAINGRTRGIYQIEEHVDPSFLERNRITSMLLIKQRDTWNDDLRSYRSKHSSATNAVSNYGLSHNTPFVGEIANLDAEAAPDNQQILFLYRQLMESEDASPYIDFDQFASCYAAYTIFGSPHSFTGDNFQMIFERTSGNFIPLFDIDNQMLALNDNIEHRIAFYGKYPNRLAYLLIQNDAFRLLKNHKLYEVVKDKKLVGSILGAVKRNSRIYEHDPIITGLEVRKERDFALATMKGNIAAIKDSLEYATLFLNVIKNINEVRIEIIPDTFGAVTIDKLDLALSHSQSGLLEIELTDANGTQIRKTQLQLDSTKQISLGKALSDIELMAGLDDQAELVKRKYVLTLRGFGTEPFIIQDATLSARNSISGVALPPGDVYIGIADGSAIHPEARGVVSFSLNRSALPLASVDGTLVLKPGRHILSEDLILPRWTKLVIEAGVDLRIAPGKSLVCYGSLEARGTAEAPIVITKASADPFGTFAVVGRKEDRVVIRHLDISGGNEARVDGLYLSGALSLYHVGTVSISDSKIHDNHADDGLNVKNSSNLTIMRDSFHNNFADQVDLDFCTGTITDSSFKDPGGDDNGDGLDLSGSKAIVSGNLFNDFKDKGISIGEETTVLIVDNTFEKNRSAITGKDKSKVYLLKNNYRDNKRQVELYQKKEIFGFPTLFILNDDLYSVDRHGESRVFGLNVPYASSIPLSLDSIGQLESLSWQESSKW